MYGLIDENSKVKFSENYIHIDNGDVHIKFSIEKGNNKLPPSWYIGNTGSGSDCISDDLELCPYGLKNGDGSCYCIKAERMYPYCLPCRENNKVAWRDIIFGGFVEEFVLGLLLATKQARKHKMKVFRFNESYDIESDKSLIGMWIVAVHLRDIGVPTMTYTHREDMIGEISFCEELIVNGSDFMVDNEFRVVDKFTGKNLKCCGDCGICQKAYLGGWCTIKVCDLSCEEIQWLSNYLHKKGLDEEMLLNGLVIEVLKH